MAVKGTIFYHKKYEVRNGLSKEKLLILLNTPSENETYLVVLTTSKKNGKPTTQGCIENRKLFFIPANTSFFEKPTWVLLFTLSELTADYVSKDPNIIVLDKLDPRLINEIINCLLRAMADDITLNQKKLLKPLVDENLQKLKDEFNKRRM